MCEIELSVNLLKLTNNSQICCSLHAPQFFKPQVRLWLDSRGDGGTTATTVCVVNKYVFHVSLGLQWLVKVSGPP